MTTSPFQPLYERLHQADGKLPKQLIQSLVRSIDQTIFEKCGEFIHRSLDEKIHTEEDVKAVIAFCPSALSQMGEFENLPIHSAARYPKSASFVPLLAQEGIRLNVGGDGDGDQANARGGLLIRNEFGMNVLQNLSYDRFHETKYLEVLVKLRELHFLEKDDIRRFNLLFHSCEKHAQARFEYLSDWDPEALSMDVNGKPLIHEIISRYRNVNHSRVVLMFSTALKYFPEKIGLLLQRDNNGKTAYDVYAAACHKNGKTKDSWRIIKQCLEKCTSQRMTEIDTTMNIYPFMHFSAGGSKNLNLVHYLLRRDPKIFDCLE